MKRLAIPASTPAAIELWQVDFDFAGQEGSDDWRCLSADELAHAARYRQPQDGVRYRAMRAGLRQLLGQRLDCDPRALTFVRNAYGKPSLSSTCGLNFNQSHAGAFGLLALSDVLEVGVDIEYCDTTLAAAELAGMAAQTLSRHEWQQTAGVLTATDFFRCWVGKEAALKALGVGIGEHLQALSACVAEDGSYTLFHDQPAWPQVHARRLDSPPGYAAALAWIHPVVTEISN
jgi:4'-phosphopantetheinyl transferase